MTETAPQDVVTSAPVVEVGWVLAGRLDEADVKAIYTARTRMLDQLQQQFPAFSWRMPLVRRREAILEERAEPVALLDFGVLERDDKRWDYALVVTGAELESYFKPFALGAPARSVNVAVLSTARLDPAALLTTVDSEQRVEVMARRITALALHLFGHLNDLPHSDDPRDYMFDLTTVTDLDDMQRYCEDDENDLGRELQDVADIRLEETESFRGRSLIFFLRAAAQNSGDILSAIARMGPWEFPFRFSRLTTAAISTMVVLIITAEAWDLGMSQPPWLVTMLSLIALGGTSLYILRRQQLLVRRRKERLSEQRVIGNVSVVLATLLGMATTYLLLFGGTLLLTRTLFSRHLVEGWAASLDGHIGLRHYLVLAGFVASLGLAIGALGASFEEQTYFRHVAFVDEET